ncbi:MAG: PAS domain-containing protein [Bdellovibrionota bacterium]
MGNPKEKQIRKKDETLQLSILEFDARGKIIFWSRNIFSIFQIPNQENFDIGTFKNSYSEKDWIHLNKIIEGNTNNNSSTEISIKCHTPNNSEFILKHSFQSITDQDGSVKLILILQTIDHNAEDPKYKLIAETINEGSWEWNLETDTTDISEHFWKFLGYSHQNVQFPTSWSELIHKSDYDKLVIKFENYIKNKKAEKFSKNLRFRKKNGDWTWIKIEGTITEWSDLHHPKKLLGIFRDINNEVKSVDEFQALTKGMEKHTIIARANLKGNITFANDLFCQISGYNREELIGQNHNILNSGYHSKSFFRDMWKCICSGKQWKGVVRNRSKKGSIYWVDTTITPLIDKAGKVQEYIAFRYDITEQVRAQAKDNLIAKIRRSYIEKDENIDKFLRFTLSEIIEYTESKAGFIEEVTCEKDIQNPITTIDDLEICRCHDKENLIAININHKNTYKIASFIHNETIKSNAPIIIPSNIDNILTKDIAIKSHDIDTLISVPLCISDTKVAVLTLCNREVGYSHQYYQELKPILDNITVMIHNMQARKAASDKENERKFILENARVGLWTYYPDKQQLKWDNSMYSLYDIKKDEYQDDYEAWKSSLHPEDMNLYTSNLIHTLSGNKPFDVQFKILTRDDKIKYIRSKAEVIKDRKNNVLKVVGVNWDITKEASLESDLENQKNLSYHHAKLASIGEIAAGVGHEINNPLSIAHGYLSAMKRSIDSNQPLSRDEFKKYQEKIEMALNRIINIVKGLRTYSRSDGANLSIIEPIEALNESIGMVKEIYARNGFDIITDFSNCPSNVKIEGNRGKIQQVFMNLISNAKDATEGQEQRKLAISAKLQENYLNLIFTDTGCGIPDNIKDKIFTSYFTTKDAGSGTGIGLSLTHNLIKEIKGNISFTSSPGEGTQFKLMLPLCTSEAYADKKPSEINHLMDDTLSLYSNGTINEKVRSRFNALIVDDEKDIRELLSNLLSESGLNITAVENGKIAFDTLTKNPNTYDIIISDIKMPEMDGPNLFENITKGKIKLARLPKLIIISGDGLNKSLEDIEHLVDAYIHKPFNDQEILNLIDELLKSIRKDNAA